MECISPCSSGNHLFHLFLALLLLAGACAAIISPASAEIGFTQKWIGSPEWLNEKVNTSTETDLFKIMQDESEESKAAASDLIATGKEFLRGGSYIEADDPFVMALTFHDSDQFDARLGHALALEGLKRYQGALDAYEYSIGLVKEQKYAWLPLAGKGRCLLETQKYQDAISTYQLAIEKFESDGTDKQQHLINLYEGLAYAYEKAGQKSDADAAKKKADELRA